MAARTSVIVCCLLYVLPAVLCQECTIFVPTTPCQKANFSGGTVSEQCVLEFRAFIPSVRTYTQQTATSTGLTPFFKLSKATIGIVAKSPPWDAIKAFLATKPPPGQSATDKLLNWEKTRFFIAAGFGIFWALTAVIAGITFCCCRCQGRCCAQKFFIHRQSDTQVRFFLTLCVGLTACFLLGSATIMYLTNARVGEALGLVTNVVYTSLDRLETFTNNTAAEVKFVTKDQINFITDQMLQQITQLGNEAASVGLAQFQQPVNRTAQQVLQLSAGATSALAALRSIRNKTEALTALQLSIASAIAGAAISPCVDPNPCIELNAQLGAVTTASYTFPDLTGHITTVQNVVNRNISRQVAAGLAKFNDIPCDILNRTAKVRSDVRKLVVDYRKTVDEKIDPLVASLGPNLTAKLNITNVKTITKTTSDAIKKFDLYRKVAGYLLACLSLLVMLCMVAGMTCGCCGFEDGAKATHRSGASNCGSTVIMIGVYSAIVFTFFLMLLCTIIFAIGGHMHLMCPSLKNLEFFTETLDDVPNTSQDYFLGKALLGNGTYNLTMRGVIEDCRNNYSSYRALKLGMKYNISGFLDSSSITNSIDQQLSTLSSSFNLGANNFLSADARSSLTAFNTSGIQNVNTTAIRAEANKAQITPEQSMNASDSYAAALMLPGLTAAEIQAITNSEASFNLAVAEADKIAPLVATLANDLDTLRNISSNLEVTISSVLMSADNLTAEITKFTSGFGNTTANKYGNRLKSWIVQFFNFANNYVTTKAANCGPLASIYDDVHTFVCDFMVDTLNGFWLSCGWACFFFIPSIFMGTKLSTFYCRMKYEEGFDDGQVELTDMSDITYNDALTITGEKGLRY